LERFLYDPQTGNLYWKKRKVREGRYFKNDKTWNTRYAGKLVGIPDFEGRREAQLDYESRQVACIIFKMLYNEEPQEVEHKDNNPGNNRQENLRAANHKQNVHNQRKRKDNTSGAKGVYLSDHNGYAYWLGEIVHNGKMYRTKFFNIKKYPNAKELAIEATRALREQLHGDFANHG
jgi:hypothetical protein